MHSINVIYFIQDPPPINDVTASATTTPSDLSGFDIYIMWTVSGLCTCRSIAVCTKYAYIITYVHAYVHMWYQYL